MAITGGYITVNGIKTYYETNNGPRSGKGSFVCLHTAGRDTRQYHGIMDILSDKYEVLAFDMPAHGKSWPLPGNKAINQYSEYSAFVWAFIQAMGIYRPIVAGCSVGGNMVYHLAANYPVAAVISMQGSACIKALNTSYGATVELIDNPYVSCQHSHLDFTESLIGRNCPPEAADFIMWGVRQECGVAKKGDLQIYNNYDVTGELKKITCPVMVVRGEDDWNVPEHYARTAIDGLVNAKKVLWRPVPGYGHFIVLEAPEIVAGLFEEMASEI